MKDLSFVVIANIYPLPIVGPKCFPSMNSLSICNLMEFISVCFFLIVPLFSFLVLLIVSGIDEGGDMMDRDSASHSSSLNGTDSNSSDHKKNSDNGNNDSNTRTVSGCPAARRLQQELEMGVGDVVSSFLLFA